MQVAPQSIPAGADCTLACPSVSTVSRALAGGGGLVNTAVIELSASSVRSQRPTPEQAAPQPEKVAPALGSASNIRCVPLGRRCVHAALQSIPEAWTAPSPVTAIARATFTGATDWSCGVDCPPHQPRPPDAQAHRHRPPRRKVDPALRPANGKAGSAAGERPSPRAFSAAGAMPRRLCQRSRTQEIYFPASLNRAACAIR
jgi:hypothetical protein